MTDIVMDSVDSTIIIDDAEYELIEMTTDISRYTETDAITATVVDRDFEQEPRQDDTIKVWVNDEKIYEGWINRVEFLDDGSFKCHALNDLHYMKTQTVSLSATDQPVPLSEIVTDVCETVGVNYNLDLNWYTNEAVEMIQEGDTTPDAVDLNVQIDETESQAAKVLDKLAKWSNADWWFDNNNVLQFGMPNSELHEIEFIRNASASDMLPPYRGVVVVGDSVVSEFGWAASKLPAEFPLIAERGIVYNEQKGQWTTVEEALEPSFTLKDKQIKTKTQAEFAANKLAAELFKQVKGGKIEFVGTKSKNSASIDALDVIEMPQNMGGERYFVGRINHQIDSRNGYRITVEAEGLVPGRYGVDRIEVES